MFQRGRKNFLVRGLDGTLESRKSFGQVSFSSDVLSQMPCQGGMGGIKGHLYGIIGQDILEGVSEEDRCLPYGAPSSFGPKSP